VTTHPDDRGIPRMDHYGEGRQPFDDILDAGWAPKFAAGNVLKYLRRTKAPEHSLESARWYWARLNEMAAGALRPLALQSNPDYPYSVLARGHDLHSRQVLAKLRAMLTHDELNRLTEG
jgi:hypothetical protein